MMPWYQYTALAGMQPRPFIEARLWHGTRSLTLFALVDSGAEFSLLGASYADSLGLQRAHAQTTYGVGAGGNRFPILRWSTVSLEVEFQRRRFPFRGGFADLPPGSDAVNILGRDDFFQEFVVQFWEAAELMNIAVSPDYPAPPVA